MIVPVSLAVSLAPCDRGHQRIPASPGVGFDVTLTKGFAHALQ